MEKPSQHTPTLAELAAEFLLSIPEKDRAKNQVDVYRFIRWLGIRGKPNELNPANVASYGEQVTPLEARSIKSFLTYIKKREFTTLNLASHVRPKKRSPKMVPSGRNYRRETILTKEGHAKLKAELTNLKDQCSEVIEEMRKAAADKDFRENAPLAAARERKARLEGRIQELEATLKLAKLMDESQNTAKVKMGDTVILYELSSGNKLSYVLVDSQEANPIKGKLSIASPLGKALQDKEKGGTIEVSAPAGVFSYRIEDIQHNYALDFEEKGFD